MNRHLHRIIFNARQGHADGGARNSQQHGEDKSKTKGRPGGAGAAVKAVALLGAWLRYMPGQVSDQGIPP
jgi:filamentous hemagglutinin